MRTHTPLIAAGAVAAGAVLLTAFGAVSLSPVDSGEHAVEAIDGQALPPVAVADDEETREAVQPYLVVESQPPARDDDQGETGPRVRTPVPRAVTDTAAESRPGGAPTSAAPAAPTPSTPPVATTPPATPTPDGDDAAADAPSSGDHPSGDPTGDPEHPSDDPEGEGAAGEEPIDAADADPAAPPATGPGRSDDALGDSDPVSSPDRVAPIVETTAVEPPVHSVE